ncbi:hypothetical protein Q8A73_007242 [Channa argus]|nr:hypothetical protein Q8A73_007242 [Channa argus]
MSWHVAPPGATSFQTATQREHRARQRKEGAAARGQVNARASTSAGGKQQNGKEERLICERVLRWLQLIDEVKVGFVSPNRTEQHREMDLALVKEKAPAGRRQGGGGGRELS